MKCPYCGNDDLDKFMYPEEEGGPFVICLACNGEFEENEIEYYEKQSGDEEESEEDKLISLSAIVQMLDKEIKWSKENAYKVDSHHAEWFINGLGQAKYLILELVKGVYQDPPKEDLPTETPGYMGDYGGIPHGPFDL